MQEYLIGVIATLSGAILAYIFRENIEGILNLIFRNIYPKIGGQWKVYGYFSDSEFSILDLDEDELIEYLNEEGVDEEEIAEALEDKKEHENNKIPSDISNEELIKGLKEDDFYIIADIEQMANKINGYLNSFSEGKIVRKVKLKGKITPTRIIILSTEDKTEGCHNFGTFLVKLSPDSKYMKGYETYLCSECEETAYSNVIMERMKK